MDFKFVGDFYVNCNVFYWKNSSIKNNVIHLTVDEKGVFHE